MFNFFLGFLRFKTQLALSTFTLIGMMYMSTGSLSPYAITLDPKANLTAINYPCVYVFNGDIGHYYALYRFLDGAPANEWQATVTQRRILYPLLAYPIMKMFDILIGGPTMKELGWLWGGMTTNFLIHIFALWSFVYASYRRFGKWSAISASWLIATYPGIAYWVGQPIANAMIVPCCLLLMVLL